jgi:hypothetical protein
MGPELGELAVQIVRFFDDSFPGFVVCEFVDAERRIHTLVDKVPVVTTNDVHASSAFPQLGSLRCTVLERWQEESGRELVRVNVAYPDGVETTEGLVEFVVPSANVAWIPRGHREPNAQGFLVWVDDE